MKEILPGLYHWRAFNSYIDDDVDSCYAVLDPPVLLDPMEPKEGIEWFQHIGAPAHVYMTNRLHDRHCRRFIDTYNATVWCHRAGLHEFQDGSLAVTGFKHGDVLPGNVTAIKVGVLCPEETAFLLPMGDGVLAIGDALVRWKSKIGLVPDDLLGDDPPAVKAGLKEAFLRICSDYEFDHLVFAHGNPIIGGGKEKLRRYLKTMKG